MKKLNNPLYLVLVGLISFTWMNLAHSEGQDTFITRMPDSEIRNSLNNIHYDICECLAFFIAGSVKVKEQGATDDDLAQVNEASIQLVELARSLHQDKVTEARIGLASDQMMKEMDYDYVNFSILLQNYQKKCVELSNDVYQEVFHLLVEAEKEGLL